jgi:hypothetical protein
MDENVTGLRLADILNAHSEQYECTFVTFPITTHRGADDEDVPSIATELGATALLSINVKHFGAKEQYFRALVAAGVSVVSLRIRSSDAGDREYITSTLTKHARKIAKILTNAEESVVISVDKSNARAASLQEILENDLS